MPSALLPLRPASWPGGCSAALALPAGRVATIAPACIMRSTAVAPNPAGVGSYSRRRCFPERELSVALFGGLREVVASVSYFVQWVSDEFYGGGCKAPHVQVRGVYSLATGGRLYVGSAQEQALAEQLEELLFHEGQDA